MKIGIVTNLYPPYHRGGAEKVLQRIVRGLKRRDHDVFVISTIPIRWNGKFRWNGKSPHAPQLHEKNIERIYRFYPFNVYHTLKDRFYPFPVRFLWHVIDTYCRCTPARIAHVLEKEKPDVVLTHNLKGVGLRLPEMLRKKNIPFIHTLHDVQLSIPSGVKMLGKEPLIYRGWPRKTYERAVQKSFGSPKVVISASQYLANFYRERGFFPESDIRVIPNPAPKIELPPRGQRYPGPIRLLFAGQLEHHKGIKMLLDAIGKLDFPIELHIAGDGSLADYVRSREKIDPSVIYHGFVSTDQLISLFELADATVVPSLCFENSPTVIYESFQAGVPVIAADIGGTGELVEDGVTGLLFEPDNEDALVCALQDMRNKCDEFRSREKIIRESMKPHEMSAYLDKLEKLIKNVI